MKKIIIASAFVALSATMSVGAQAQKIGSAVVAVVETDRIFRECNACKVAQGQLQTQLQQIQTRAQQLGQPIETEAASIRTAVGNKAPDAAAQARIQALQTKQNAAQEELGAAEQNFRRNQGFVAQQIQAKLDTIYSQVMTSRGATVLLDTAATLARSSSIDVTNDVLAQLNQQLPTLNTTAPPPPAAPAAQPQER